MEEKNFLSKKTKRQNDKNIPKYTKQDELKYNEKNKLLEKEKKLKEKNKITKEEREEKNKEQNEEEEISQEEENVLNELLDKDSDNNYNLFNKLKKKLIIILEGATLELGNVKKNPQIINCDDHYKIIKSMKKKLDEFRPDIIHQCLLNLFDSPLNKVGLLQVYIHTNKNILIEINPKTRIPRTFKRFSGLFSQLFLKNEIGIGDNSHKEIFLKILNVKLENIIQDIPKILLSEKGRLVDIDTYCKNLENNIKDKKNKNICFIIGTNPKGDIDPMIKYNDDCISLSSFDLDSNVVCAKICSAFENSWGVL
jgi:rRNA small subunit pseudouridine methyltransferase Nep1